MHCCCKCPDLDTGYVVDGGLVRTVPSVMRRAILLSASTFRAQGNRGGVFF